MAASARFCLLSGIPSHPRVSREFCPSSQPLHLQAVLVWGCTFMYRNQHIVCLSHFASLYTHFKTTVEFMHCGLGLVGRCGPQSRFCVRRYPLNNISTLSSHTHTFCAYWHTRRARFTFSVLRASFVYMETFAVQNSWWTQRILCWNLHVGHTLGMEAGK